MEKISYSQVESSCNQLHEIANEMKINMETIQNCGKKLSGCWEGPASEFYVSKLSELSKNFDPFYESIESSILWMAKCSEGYQAIDKNVINEICGNLGISDPDAAYQAQSITPAAPVLEGDGSNWHSNL